MLTTRKARDIKRIYLSFLFVVFAREQKKRRIMHKTLVVRVATLAVVFATLTGCGATYKATTGAVLGGGSPTTIAKMVALGPAGKVIFSDWTVFTGGLLANKGDVTRPSSVDNMVVTMVDRYVDSVVKP